MQRSHSLRFAFVTMLAGLGACGAPDENLDDTEPTLAVPQPITATASQNASGDPTRSAASITVATTTLGKGTAVTAYASKPDGAATAAWSFSTNGGTSWSAHRSDEAGAFQWPKAPVDDGKFAYYGDAPTVLSLDSIPGVVVAIATAYDANAHPLDVIALVSTDGGAHFKNPTLVTTETYAGTPSTPLLAYVTAGPVMGPGPVVGAAVWTLYRDHNAWFMRKLSYDALTQSMKLAGNGAPIRVTPIPDGTKGTKPAGPSSIGSTIEDGNDELVFVTWSSYDNLFDVCTIQPPKQSHTEVVWTLSVAHWSSGAGVIGDWIDKYGPVGGFHWPLCVGAGTQYFKNNPVAAMAIDPVTHSLWFTNVLGSGATPEVGSHISITHILAPVFKNSGIGSNVLDPTKTEDGTPLPGTHDQWGPSIAILHPVGAANPTVAIAWHDTRDDPANPGAQTSMWGAITQSEGMNPLVVSVGRITPLSPGPLPVPWALTDHWGRYDGMAANPATGDFLVAWGDNRSGGKTQVWTSRIAP